MKRVQILYPMDKTTGEIHRWFSDEAKMMEQRGFMVDIVPLQEANVIIKRGFTICNEHDYPADSRMLQGWTENKRTLDFSEFAEIIRPWSIPFAMIENIGDEEKLKSILKCNEWERVFIRSKSTSLFAYGDLASVYPDTSLTIMADRFKELDADGPFIVRKYLDDKTIFYDEQRYWILNGTPYHPSGVIPEMVRVCAGRMYEFSGSKYFVIDVAGSYVVEVNPGESSDRGGDNSLEFFSEIFAKEFL